jgi:hypothetical protein
MTAIRASLIRETNCDASVPTPVTAFVDRRYLDGSASSSNSSAASTKLIEKGHQSVSRDPTQATDPNRLNRAGTDQRIHDRSSDAKPIGRFFHGQDKRQPELIKLPHRLPRSTPTQLLGTSKRLSSEPILPPLPRNPLSEVPFRCYEKGT